MSCEKAAVQDELRQYVASSRAQLQQLLQRLHWTEQGVLQHHRPPIPATGSVLLAEQLPPSCSRPAEHSVQLTAAQLQQLLPELRPPQQLLEANSFDDLQANFSAAQKLLIYEHVLSRTPRQPPSCEQNANFAQLVAETRRAHRKQRRHRKSKPTLHEEMHQLVELQMQAFQQQQQQQRQQQPLPAVAGRHELLPRRRSRSRSRERSRRSLPKQRSRSRSRRHHKGKRKHSKRSRSRCRSRSPRIHKRTKYN
ncbi:bromodomain-containing protein DDB_G0280777 isoform X2 [Drosophila montana]|uniref:bromodomain-containing protein DDB_G0280777 isoform X2 n=1 Tax=Drosophila montana TaxID=40370 RepID=UPI00313D2829